MEAAPEAESPVQQSMESPVKRSDVKLAVEVPINTEGRGSPKSTTPRSSLHLPKSPQPQRPSLSDLLDGPFGVCLGAGLTAVWVTAVFWAPLLWPAWYTSVLIGVSGLLVVYVSSINTMTGCCALVAWAMASSAAGMYSLSNMGNNWGLKTALVSVSEVSFVPEAPSFAFTDGVVDYSRVFSGQVSGCSRSNNMNRCHTRTVFLTPVFADDCRPPAECFRFALIVPHQSNARAEDTTLPVEPFAGRVCERMCGYREDPRYAMDDYPFRVPLEAACQNMARGLGAPNASGLAGRCAGEYLFAGSPSEVFSEYRPWAIGLHVAAGIVLCLVQCVVSTQKITKTNE